MPSGPALGYADSLSLGVGLALVLSGSLGYSWASLVAQLIKNPPAMWEINLDLIPGLGRSPGEEKGYPLQRSCPENIMDYSSWSRKESDMTEDFHFHLGYSYAE